MVQVLVIAFQAQVLPVRARQLTEVRVKRSVHAVAANTHVAEE